jgi:hypothetical protein
MEPYYTYFKGQWILGKIDETYINTQVTKGRLTPEEAQEIISLPRG